MGNVVFLPDYCAIQREGVKPLDKVGVDEVGMFRLDFSEQRVMTEQSAYISLIAANGIHMSRLLEVLFRYEYEEIEPSFEILDLLAVSHDVTNAYWECKWTYEHMLENEQPLFVNCALEGVLTDDKDSWYLTVQVPYASVCPCSAEMTAIYGGHPHIQRAYAKVTGLLDNSGELDNFLTAVVSKVVSVVGLVPFPIMKRQDELEWCQHAAQNKLFVEDAARNISDAIDHWYKDWVVVCKHYESIHQHSVVAVRKKGDKLV